MFFIAGCLGGAIPYAAITVTLVGHAGGVAMRPVLTSLRRADVRQGNGGATG